MNDIIDTSATPEQPNQPIIDAASDKSKSINRVGRKKGTLVGVLELLPEEIKNELDTLLTQKQISVVKAHMAEKHGKENPALTIISLNSYKRYKAKHKERLEKQLSLQNQIASPPPEMLSTINAITNPNITIDDKRKALTDLFNVCESRRQMLELRNQTFIDPYIEKLRNENINTQIKIIEKLAILNEQLVKEAQIDHLQEFENFYCVIIASVGNTYRMINGNNNYEQFVTLLDANLANTLKNYRVEKAKLQTPRS